MRLTRICFNNFGILRNQVMESVHPGLVVIAGPNRAGKTTFMTALRYLGYGLPNKDFIPAPLSGSHDYSADVALPDDSSYTIHIIGYGSPKVLPIASSPNKEVNQIFSNVDELTYRQIFTISLDELRRIPEGLESKEEEHLRLVLLGGGWVDALRLAKFKKEFGATAYSIGASRGSKDVREFKPYWGRIKEGKKERDEANKQLEEYYSRLEKLDRLENKIIPDIEKDLARLRRELEFLEIMKDHYFDYQNVLLLEGKLSENKDLLSSYPVDGLTLGLRLQSEYDERAAEYEAAFHDFSNTTGTTDPDIFVSQEDVLLTFEKKASGWKEKVKGYRDDWTALGNEKEEFSRKLNAINQVWGDDLAVLGQIAVDRINRENLRVDVEEYKTTAKRLDEVLQEKRAARASHEKKQKEKRAFREENAVPPTNLALIMVSALLATLLIGVFSPLIALGVGFVLAAFVVIHHLSHQFKEREFAARLNLLNRDIDDLEEKLTTFEVEEDTLGKRLGEAKDRLSQAVDFLNLPKSTPYELLADLHGEMASLRERYAIWQKNQGKLKARHMELEKIFADLRHVLEPLVDLKQEGAGSDQGFLLSERAFEALEKALKHLRSARRLKLAKRNKDSLEEKIVELLQKENPSVAACNSPDIKALLTSFIKRGERYQEVKEEQRTYKELSLALRSSLSIQRRKQILLNHKDAENVLDAYGAHFSTYASFLEIERKHSDAARELEKTRANRDSELGRRILLEKAIEDLSSDKKLEDAHNKIMKAQDKLESLAEQYAVYRLAEFMVGEVHKTFVERTKGSILDSAGHVFQELTSGDYDKIDVPSSQFEEAPTGLDFKVKELDQAKLMPSHKLSRATKEQLFLSVRLSRIGNMDPLPVIFDDSLVNFDPRHSRQVARLIAQLSDTHQVFVLTCHPEFVNCLQDCTDFAQYWSLDKGIIKGPYNTCGSAMDLLHP